VSADTWLTVRRQESRSVFFRKAVWQHGLPDKVTVDKSGANTAAIDALQEEAGHDIEISQIKYLNNLVEQDHFMLSGHRDEAAATAFFKQAINANGLPEKVLMDKSGANNYAGWDDINLLLLPRFRI
jgi:transposase-like protein